jgi:uncharacterized protein (DUF4415 family)
MRKANDGNKRPLGSDLAKVDATTDEDIARQIAEDPDTAPELTEEWFAGAEAWHGNKFLGHGRDFKGGRKVGRPKGSGTKELVTLRLDHAILHHFRAGGPGWRTRLNDALLAFSVKPSKKVGDRIGAATVVAVEPAANAHLIIEVLKAMPSGTARPAEIRKALQADKGVSMAFTSIRHALGQLATRHVAAASDDGKTWRYLGGSA